MDHITSILKISAAFAAFAIVHSLLVTNKLKRAASASCGENTIKALYRFTYTVVSAVTFLLVAFFIMKVENTHIYSLPLAVKLPFHAIQFAGLLIILVSFKKINLFEFLGLKQILAYIAGREPGGDIEGLTVNGLITTGIYSLTRNPLYLGSILIVTFNPIITTTSLTLAALCDIYFIFGALIEQKRWLQRFDSYKEYSDKVPLLFPKPAAIIKYITGGVKKDG